MKANITILLTLFLLISCSNSADQGELEDGEFEDRELEDVESKLEIEVDTILSFYSDQYENPGIPDGWTQIKFNDLTVLIEDIQMGWDDQESFYDRSSQVEEIAYFNLYIGDWNSGKRIQIEETEFDSIQIYVQEVIHVAMTSDREIEVPFCVLTNWKSLTSEWAQIEQSKDLMIFNTEDAIHTDSIRYNLEDFKNAVRESCGEKWYEEISQIETMDDIRASEFTSQYNYKIVAHDTKTGRRVERIIVFFTPTHC